MGRFRRPLTSYVPGPGGPKDSMSRTASPRPGVSGTTARKSRLPCGC